LIGGETALDALGSYSGDWRQTVHNALIRAWEHFDREEFANRVMSRFEHLSISRLDSFEGFQLFVSLETLSVVEFRGRDLSPLSKLLKLDRVAIYNAWWLDSIEPLAGHPSLSYLHIGKPYRKTLDISCLPTIPHLHYAFVNGDSVDLRA